MLVILLVLIGWKALIALREHWFLRGNEAWLLVFFQQLSQWIMSRIGLFLRNIDDHFGAKFSLCRQFVEGRIALLANRRIAKAKA